MVFLWVRFSGHGEGSGAPVEMELAHVLTMRDGKVARTVEYFDRAEALEAAGLSGVGDVGGERRACTGSDRCSQLRRFGRRLAFPSLCRLGGPARCPWDWRAVPGRAEVRGWIEELWEVAEGVVHTEIEQITDLGEDRVFLALVLTARGRGSGVPFEMPTWSVVWFAEGLVTRRQVFWARDEALEAAGLQE